MDKQTPQFDLKRLKLLHVLIYFSNEVMGPGKIKVFKLLNYLDFLHFEKTGRPVTGLEYNAWKWGPVPVELFEEYDAPGPDFRETFMIKTVDGAVTLAPRLPFNEDYFSDLELRLMKSLAKKHFRHTAAQMSEDSHFETGPWHEVYEVNDHKQGHIPYALTLERRGSAEDLEMLEYSKLSNAVRKNFE